MSYKNLFNGLFLITIIASVGFSQSKPKLQTKNQAAVGKEMTILVTAYPENKKQNEIVAKLHNNDFAVLENKRS